MNSALVIGAGIAGAAAARFLAEDGYNVTVLEKNSYVGGACHDHLDEKHKCYVHDFGPHIFHTKDSAVWDFVNKFAEFKQYRHKVFTKVDDKFYSFPINLNVLSELFNTKIYSKEHALALINPAHFEKPANFEEAALNAVGEVIYEKFVKNYTEKQWKISCKELPVEVFKRVNIRFNYDDGYFENQYQGIPKYGYTNMIKNMLNHENIKVYLNSTVTNFNDIPHDLLVYTGGFDKLPYRSTKFEFRIDKADEYAVVNTPQHPTQTRYTNFNVLHSSEDYSTEKENVYCYEIPAEINQYNKLYPIATKENLEMCENEKDKFLSKYPKTIFLGRLATYKYFDMDKVIEQVLNRI